MKNIKSIVTGLYMGIAAFTCAFSVNADQIINLKSGNGAVGGADGQITFLGGPADTAFGTAFTPADFTAASSGSAASIVAPIPGWLLPTAFTPDPTAQWISDNPSGATSSGSSALYAIDFTITDPTIASASIDFNFAVDNLLGTGPNQGLYLNGTALSGVTGGGFFTSVFNIQRFDIAPLLVTGTNTLFINLTDGGGGSGLIFSATISVDDGIASVNAPGMGLIFLMGVIGLAIWRKKPAGHIASILGALMSIVLLSSAHTAKAAVLLHEYTFDGAGVIDNVGGQNGTLVNGATVSGGVLSLNGASQFAEFGTKLIPGGAGGFSITMDAKETAPSGTFVELISQGFAFAPGFYLGHDAAGNFRFGDQINSTSVAYPTDNAEHAFAITSGISGTIFYIDSSVVFTSATQLLMPTGGTNTRLGAQYDSFGEYFNGTIDNVRIYDGVLTASEVTGVPTPATMALFVVGLVGLGVARRMRGV